MLNGLPSWGGQQVAAPLKSMWLPWVTLMAWEVAAQESAQSLYGAAILPLVYLPLHEQLRNNGGLALPSHFYAFGKCVLHIHPEEFLHLPKVRSSKRAQLRPFGKHTLQPGLDAEMEAKLRKVIRVTKCLTKFVWPLFKEL